MPSLLLNAVANDGISRTSYSPMLVSSVGLNFAFLSPALTIPLPTVLSLVVKKDQASNKGSYIGAVVMHNSYIESLSVVPMHSQSILAVIFPKSSPSVHRK